MSMQSVRTVGLGLLLGLAACGGLGACSGVGVSPVSSEARIVHPEADAQRTLTLSRELLY